MIRHQAFYAQGPMEEDARREMVDRLCEELVKEQRLTHIYIENCGIVDEDACRLRFAIEFSAEIRTLVLADNAITESGVRMLIQTKGLSRLVLTGNPFEVGSVLTEVSRAPLELSVLHLATDEHNNTPPDMPLRARRKRDRIHAAWIEDHRWLKM